MDGRTNFVVAWMAILYLCSWLFSLSGLFGIHFWDREYALEYNAEHYVSINLYNSTAFGKINAAYFSPSRYCYLLPHVLGAIFWWNLYFLQLIPQVRYAFDKKLHRILGRCLMICAFAQTASGVGLALTSHSNIILLVSLWLAGATFYCIYCAWKNAIYRDIPKHKYWVLRLVGYMQTIAFQRFWLVALISSHQMGWYRLYPELIEGESTVEEANQVVLEMFDDSFVLAILTAFLGTEWYLAGMQGMTDAPEPSYSTGNSASNNHNTSSSVNSDKKEILPHENVPLMAK